MGRGRADGAGMQVGALGAVAGMELMQRAAKAALCKHVADKRLEHDAIDELQLRDGEVDDGCERLQRLLTLLPLLRMDNERCKDMYVAAAPALVQRCVDAPRRPNVVPELCRQLLSYLLVHPTLTHHDKGLKDCPGVKLKCVRGKYDLPHVIKQKV